MISPVAGNVLLGHHDEHTASAVAVLDPADQVFAGHYPDFPVTPGVLLIDYVRLTVVAWQRAVGADTLRLSTVERCRFRDPVRPGDEIAVHVTGSAGRRLAVDADVRVGGRLAAEIRVTFEGVRR
jgi:3-hydroxyacyl-[acyl-carrier-protein] dehydratase